MHCIKRALFLFIFYPIVLSSAGQSTAGIDSLENLLRKNPDANNTVALLNELALRLRSQDIEKSKERAEEALKIAIDEGYQEGEAVASIHLGHYYRVKATYDSAFQWFDQALNIGKKKNDLVIQSQALTYIGNTHRYMSNYEAAIDNLNAASALAVKVGDEYWEAFALNILGLAYQQVGNYDSSLYVSERALAIRERLGDKTEIAASLGNVGLVYDYTGDFPKALDYYYKALAMNEEIENISGAATTWNNIGIVYAMQGDSDQSLHAFEKAYQFHKQDGNKFHMAGSLDNIGINYDERGQYVKALEIYQQTLALREEINDKTGIGTSLMNIGDIYSVQNQLTEAIENYEKAMQIRRETGNKYGQADAHHSLGGAYFRLKQFDKAMEQYKNALAIRQEINNPDGIAGSYNTIGSIYLIWKDYSLAEESYQKALEIASDIGKKSSWVYALKGLANAKLGLNNPSGALTYATKASEMLENSHDLLVRQQVHETLAKIYQKMGHYQLALENHIQYASLRDSLLNTETTKQLADMQVKFDTERKERQISDQEHEISLLAASNKYRNRLIWIGGSSLLLLFGIIFAYRSRRFAIREKDLHRHYSQALLTSHEEERKRISRDLHDSVGQSLMLIKNKIVLNNDETTATMVGQALEEVRSISKALHPVLLEKLGLTASIQKLVNDFDENTDIFFSEEIDNIDGIFTNESELQIFRVVQETINNIIKHSKTPSALIKISDEPAKIQILIRDYGVGFDMTEQDYSVKSLGMKTLKERTQILGGKMVIDSVKNKGTTVLLEVPKSN